MMRIFQSDSARNAKSYFASGLEDSHGYYAAGETGEGLWFGNGAVKLGLSGNVLKDQFHLLCDNHRPDNFKKLNPRVNDKRKIGYDVTFSAPKGVSILQGVVGDKRIIDVFRKSVRETMSYIERDVHVRVRKGGVIGTRKSSNLVYAEFTHFDSRPVDGLSDANLHCHCYCFNTSYDQVENRFKAAEFFRIVKDANYYQAIFHSKLAEGLANLGYSIENKAFSFDVAGVGEENIRRFSRRTQEIEKLAQELGISGNAKAMDKLAALSRKNKSHRLKGVDQLAEWRGRLDWSALKLDQDTRMQPVIKAREAVDLAIENMFERSSVVSLRRLATDALQNSLGDCCFEEVVTEIRRNRELVVANIDGVSYVTTRQVLEEEKAILQFLKETKGSSMPMLAWYREKSDELDSDQITAVETIMRCRDRVTCIQGRAGSGKTTLMTTAVAAMESVGMNVYVFAPTSPAAHQVLKEEGFENSETVQQLLVNTTLQEQMRGKVLWVDEAGLLSAADMRKLLLIAEVQNTRVILSGDYSQHHSVGRGSAFRMVCESGEVKVSETRSIYRQKKSAYKDAVSALSHGDAHTAMGILDNSGAIKEIAEFDERLKACAEEYVSSLSQFKTILAVSPTHLEGRYLTQEIRSLMRDKHLLGDLRIDLPNYRNRNLTEAQRKQTSFYREGDVLRFHQNAKGGFMKGDFARVVAKSAEGVLVTKFGDDQHILLKSEAAAHFGVFDEGEMEVSIGDRVRITRNATSMDGKRLFNGNIHVISGIGEEGVLTLDGKCKISVSSGLVDWGYVRTSHSSQGTTCDKVILSQSALSLDASSLEQFYVSVSRGRDAISIFTDSKADLLDAVVDPEHRMLARELETSRKRMEEDDEALALDGMEMDLIGIQ